LRWVADRRQTRVPHPQGWVSSCARQSSSPAASLVSRASLQASHPQGWVGHSSFPYPFLSFPRRRESRFASVAHSKLWALSQVPHRLRWVADRRYTRVPHPQGWVSSCARQSSSPTASSCVAYVPVRHGHSPVASSVALCLLWVLPLLFLLTSSTLADTSTPKVGEQLKWQVISGGGTTIGSSTNYRLSTTLGQTAVGMGSSTSYKINQGFQQNFGGTSYVCGDANSDGAVDISDAVYLIAYIFSGGPAPSPLLAGDANCDGAIDISDAVYLIAYIFSGGPAPCAHCK
jgi:hypothetical protein